MMVRPAVLEFIGDAHGFYHNFRSELLDGDGPFLVGFIGRNAQPSHQRDYVYHALGESLGLWVEGETVPVDLHGRVVHASLEDASGEALLNAYYETVFGSGDEQMSFVEALIDRFHLHWNEQIDAGLNQTDASSEAKKGHDDFVAFLEAAGIEMNDCFEEVYDEELDSSIYELKKSAVADILNALRILQKAEPGQEGEV